MRADPKHSPAVTRLALSLAIAAFALLAFAPLSEAKVTVNGFGVPTLFTAPLPGGAVVSPEGIAVNSSAAGAPAGSVYVGGTDFRIQRFSSSGAFERAFGPDTIKAGAPGDTGTGFEVCTAAADCKGRGGGAGFAFNGVGSIAVDQATGDVYAWTNDNRVVGFDGDGNFLRSWGRDAVLSGRPGDIPGVKEQQSVTLGANTTGGTFTLGAGSSPSTPIAWNASPAEVQSTLENMDIIASGVPVSGGKIGAGNVSVTSPNPGGGGAPGGPYTITFEGLLADTDINQLIALTSGLTVSSGSPSATVATIANGAPGSGYEICAAASDCKRGIGGTDAGQFGGGSGGVAVDSAGNVWVADSGNRRIQQFDSAGNFIAAYGHNVDALGGGGGLERCTSIAAGACQAGTQGSSLGQFSANNPTEIAFDGPGNLYAIDAGNRRVQRFNPTLTTASNFAASTFSTLTTTAPEQVTAAAGGNLAFSLSNDISAGGERQIVELDPTDASVEDTSLAGAGLGEVRGLAADTATGSLYATTGSGASPRGVLVLGAPLPAPTGALDPVTVKTDTTATFSARVDPKGGWVDCAFQYSTDQAAWTDVAEPECIDLAIAGGAQAVSQQVSDLVPNQTYFFRLRTFRPLDPATAANSPVKSFSTDAPPPVITDVDAIQIADTSARMVGTIDPKHSPTAYVFEYGTTPALGSSTAPLEIGAGTDPITVSQVVSGLSPNTTYYYRLVATNLTGSTASASHILHTRAVPFPPPPGDCPNEDIRVAQGSTHLDDCRAYEMVTPPDKNQGGVDQILVQVASPQAGFSRDGNAAAFCTTAIFAEPPAQMSSVCAPYVSRRTPSGWQTASPLPPYCANDPDGSGGSLEATLSPNFDRALILFPESEACPFAPLDPAAPMPGRNLYRENLGAGAPSYELLAPLPYEVGYPQAGSLMGASEDFSHIVYNSETNQTAPPDSPAPGSFVKLYEWDNGTLRLLSKDPSNQPFTTSSTIRSSGFVTPIGSAVSADGERVYFQNATDSDGNCNSSACRLYLREGGAATIEVGVPECAVPADCGANLSPDLFLWASPGGDVALFGSCDKMTDASAPSTSCSTGGAFGVLTTGNDVKLYRWDRNAPPGNRLTDLSIDREPADGFQPKALDIIGASSDESAAGGGDAAPSNTVYFVAGGQLVSGEPTAADLNLYRWQWNGGSPKIDYLGPYRPLREDFSGENPNTLSRDPNADRYHVRVTPDGRHLALLTELAYVPAADRDSDRDFYRWDEENGWICVSCQEPGVPSAGFAGNQLLANYYSVLRSPEPEHTISDDGQRIFFATPDALVEEDVNGQGGCPRLIGPVTASVPGYQCNDVYEWNDGAVRLVSTGAATEPVFLMGATHDGANAFLMTKARLVGWDTDNGTDIYTVRVGGGFPEPPATPAPCEGDACRGAGTSPGDVPSAGTRAFRALVPPGPGSNPCGRISKRAQRKALAAKAAAKRGQAKRARALRRQARNLNRRAKRCNRRQAS